MKTPLNLDRSIFNVFCQYKSGVEALTDPATTRAEVIENILHGQDNFTDVVAVIEFNPVEGWSRNITEDVMEAVEALREPERRRHATQEQMWDRARDHRKHEAA